MIDFKDAPEVDVPAGLGKLIFKKSGVTCMPAPPKVAVKKHLTATEVAKFLRERELKGLDPVDRFQWLIRQNTRGVSLGGCGAPMCQIGVYAGLKYYRMCKRCRGNGVLSAKDHKCYNDWLSADGNRHTTYHKYNEVNSYASAS